MNLRELKCEFDDIEILYERELENTKLFLGVRETHKYLPYYIFIYWFVDAGGYARRKSDVLVFETENEARITFDCLCNFAKDAIGGHLWQEGGAV